MRRCTERKGKRLGIKAESQALAPFNLFSNDQRKFSRGRNRLNAPRITPGVDAVQPPSVRFRCWAISRRGIPERIWSKNWSCAMMFACSPFCPSYGRSHDSFFEGSFAFVAFAFVASALRSRLNPEFRRLKRQELSLFSLPYEWCSLSSHSIL